MYKYIKSEYKSQEDDMQELTDTLRKDEVEFMRYLRTPYLSSEEIAEQYMEERDSWYSLFGEIFDADEKIFMAMPKAAQDICNHTWFG